MGNVADNFMGRNSIYMDIDRPYVVSGQMLSGNIYLNITKADGFQSKGIFLQLEGEEMVRFEEEVTDTYDNDGDGNTAERRTVVRHDKREFMDMKIPIHMYRELLMPGQYTYPFSILIPQGLPGTFYESDNNPNRGGRDYQCYVRYKLQCECDSSGFLSRDIEYEKPIVMLENPLSAIEQPTVEHTAAVMFCCCIPKGDVHIKATFDKNAYRPGEMAYIVVDVNNESESDVDEINAKLMRRLSMRADGHRKEHTELMREVTIPGVPAGEKKEEIRVQLPITYENRRGGDYDEVRPGVNSRMITCSYYIMVECSVPMAPDISLNLPVTIYSAAPEYVQPQAPPGWSPVQNEMATFDNVTDYIRKGNC